MACSNLSTTTLVGRMLLLYLMIAAVYTAQGPGSHTTAYAAQGSGSHTTVYAAHDPVSSFLQHSKYKHSGMSDTHHKGGLSLLLVNIFHIVLSHIIIRNAKGYKRAHYMLWLEWDAPWVGGKVHLVMEGGNN